MVSEGKIYFAKTGEITEKVFLDPRMANRHGFICGATGTGKTVTLKVLAESFSAMGVPVFLADVKDDLSGMSQPGQDSADMQDRAKRFALAEDGFAYQGFPTQYFDIYGKRGIPLRTTVSEIGPQLLAGILGLNKTQADILSVVYKLADDENLLLCDTKDLKAILQFASENAAALESEYGRIAKQSVAAIVRAIVALEGEGADQFFGEPAINVADFFTTDPSGKGTINVLDSSSLINQPRLYSAFMLYLLSELFEVLPEVGDMDKPRVVFFFDEAHLLFDSASSELMEKIEQMIKLIRSKGVGVYFITQSPGGHPGRGRLAAGQQDRARPARLHPGGAQGAESRGGILPGEPRLRHNGAARPTGHRRSRRLDAGRKGRARRGAACLGAAARKLYGPAGRRPARPGRQDLQPLPQIQRRHRPGFRL